MATFLNSQTHSSLYLSDGNIALLARVKGDHYMVFRVHQSFLSNVSPVFQTMFSLPVPPGEALYDGVPVVELQDCATDVELFLKVLYHETSLVIKRHDPDLPLLVRSTLTLATKYEIEKLRQPIVDLLESAWPVSLWEWDLLETEIQGMVTTWHDQHSHHSASQFLDDFLPEPASAIQLAEECDVRTILPAAFYQLSRISVYAERPIPSKSDEQRVRIPNGRRTARWSLLSNINLLRLMRGKAQLLLASQELLSVSLTQRCHLDPSICSLYRQHALLQALHDECGKSPDILGALLRAQKQHSFGPDICSECMDGLRETVRHTRLAIWAKLPDFFQLP